MKKRSNIKIATPENLPFTLDEYFGQEVLQKAVELYEQIQRPLIGGVQTGMNLRNLNNWVNMLDKKTVDSRKKYSFSEYIWYKVVEQLREAGLNLGTIATFKANLLEPIKVKGVLSKMQQAKSYIHDLKLPKEQKEQLLQFILTPQTKEISDTITFTLLDIIIMESILKKLPLSIAVFTNGDYIILDKSKEHLYSEEENNRLLFDTHIRLSVSKIIKEFLSSDLSGFVVPELGLLSYAENKLYEVIHSGEYETIVIHFKDKKMKSMELKKSEDIKKRIVDILDKGEFGEIVVKKHKGIVTKIENTIKIAL